MAQAVKTPPDTLPADFKDFDKAPDTLPANFFEGKEEAKPSTTPTGTLSAGNAPTWLEDAESDVRLGGNRTLVGKTLGRLQGSDKYSGLGGVSEGVQNFMGSPVLGGLHALQGAIDDFGHPIKGNLKTLQGISEMATIPSMVMGGPGAKVAAEAIPSKKYAGELFSDLASKAGQENVKVGLRGSLDPLRRLMELGDAGHTLPKAVNQLGDQTGPMSYQKARDFASSLSNLSATDKMSILPQTRANLTRLSKALHEDIGGALAPIEGGAEKYAQALKEYSGAARLSDMGKTAAGWGAKALGAGAAYEGFQKLRKLL